MFNSEITLETFLNQYWQQKPLLFRNAFPDIQSPLSPDEMAGLACEENANSRLIIESKNKPYWSVEHGPLDENRFSKLPESNWTLLISDVEKFVPEGRELLNHFRFIPDWRIDDLMMSYAVKGGSVGAHIDAYDVFLLQVKGQRHWGINSSKDFRNAESIDNIELKILKSFTADEEWTLNPGDMLYLPPNVAHHGVAVNDCITCSIGFRAPAIQSLVSEYAESIASLHAGNERYSDPKIKLQENPGEISQEALTKLKQIIIERLKVDDDYIQRWIGEFLTEQNSATTLSVQAPQHQNNNVFEQLHKNILILHSPTAKFLYIKQQQHALLFIDGKSYNTSLIFAETICQSHEINSTDVLSSIINDGDKQVLLELFMNELLYYAE